MSECYCDYEAPSFYLKKTVKAKKEHKCLECRCKIMPGDQYERVTAKWPEFSVIDTYKTCQNCVDVRNYTLSNVPCLCWSHYEMLNDCLETIQEYSHELPGMLFGFYRLYLKSIKKAKLDHKLDHQQKRV